MALSLLKQKSYFMVIVALLTLMLLTACGGGDTSTGSATSTPTSTQAAVPPATATENAVIKLVSFVGQPKAKIDTGTTFEVDGTVKNGDSQQHDIYLQATLLDASGKTIATTAITNVDNVPANSTEDFSLKGTTPQPTWTSVKVTIQKVTENIGSSGGD